MLFVFDRIHKRGFDAQLGQPLAEEFGCAPVNVALSNNVLPSFHQRENGCGNRRHSGSEEKSGIRTFQFSDRRFGNRVSWIAVARVEHVGVRGAQLLIVVRYLERRGLINRSCQWPVFFAEVGPAVYSLSFLTMLMLLHTRSLALMLWQLPHQTPARRKAILLISDACSPAFKKGIFASDESLSS